MVKVEVRERKDIFGQGGAELYVSICLYAMILHIYIYVYIFKYHIYIYTHFFFE